MSYQGDILLLFFIACQYNSKLEQKNWIHQVLVDDNLMWKDRLELLEHKLTVMEQHPYDFMRGSLSLHIQESQRITGERKEFDLNTEDSILFFQIGDPHPENISVSVQRDQPEQSQMFWADLDASGFGPWYWDLRRAGVGLLFFAESIECDCTSQIIPALLDGYFESPTRSTSYQFQSTIIHSLVDEARDEGSESKKYNKYTSNNTIVRDEFLDEQGKGILSLNMEESLQLNRLLESISIDDSVTIHDSARRYGMGISSRPAIRYVVALEDSLRNHSELILIREVVDSVPLYTFSNYFDSNAQRIEQASKWIWDSPTPDIWYQGVQDGNLSFKVTGWNSYIQDIDREKIHEEFVDGVYSNQDMIDLATDIGVSLYLAHTSAPLYDGRPSKAILDGILLQRDHEELQSMLLDMIDDDVAQLYENYALFQEIFREKGSTIGIEYIGDAL